MKKKTVGIITILKVNNYGAELQSYATQRIMNLMGYDAEIIDYLYYRNSGHIKEKCSMPFYPYPVKNRIKEFGLYVIDKIEKIFESDSIKHRKMRFEEFHKHFNRFSTKQYRKYSELFNNPPIYDAYCVGSDQVWNPRCYTNLNPYFLKFVPNISIKFSYASSFGVKDIPDSARKQYIECLQNLSYIGVREETGVDLVQKLTGRKATWCLDPTLLLDREEWSKVETLVDGIPQRYVLVYELHSTDKIMETALFLAEELRCKIVRICKNTSSTKKRPNVINIVEAGPSEFIYLFNHATAIVTNSFHGTAFSINFRKDFYCVLTRKLLNNNRQLYLLNLCKLTNRIIYDDEPLPQWSTIDYTIASKAIEDFKIKSTNYIQEAINGQTK